MLALNHRQAVYYDNPRPCRSVMTQTWSHVRNGPFSRFRTDVRIKTDAYELHKQWLGDLSDKKILDLGCYSGNTLSPFLATNARQYIGIDLSNRGISRLAQKLLRLDCPDARAMAVDFLSPEFDEGEFDVIYAYGVMHHFEHFETFLHRLNSKLSRRGIIVSYDPMTTSLPIRCIRRLYRPFQSDAAWEWPFERSTFAAIEKVFEIDAVQGFLGCSKWAFPLYALPAPDGIRKKIATTLHHRDLRLSRQCDEKLWRCMHVALLLKKKDGLGREI